METPYHFSLTLLISRPGYLLDQFADHSQLGARRIVESADMHGSIHTARSRWVYNHGAHCATSTYSAYTASMFDSQF